MGDTGMDVCTFTELRGHLRERLDQVYSTRRPLLIARQNAAAAVIDKEECDRHHGVRWTRIFGQVAKRESRSYKLPRIRSMT